MKSLTYCFAFNQNSVGLVFGCQFLRFFTGLQSTPIFLWSFQQFQASRNHSFSLEGDTALFSYHFLWDIHSWTELSLPFAFFFPRHQKTLHKTFYCEWTYYLFRCACLLIRLPIHSSISQSLTSVIKLAVNTYQLFLKGGEVHQQLYDPIQCPEGVPYNSHNHPLIFWTFLSILVKTLKVALNWNN